jgi:general secretion pathway protein F
MLPGAPYTVLRDKESTLKSYSVKVMVNRQVKEIILAAENIAAARELANREGQVLQVKALRSSTRWDKMSLSDRLVFFQRLAAMIGSKVGTSEALDIIYQSFTGIVREAARILRDQIEHGASLADAMEAAGPRYFPESVVAIVRTGSRGGDMAYALREAGRFERELAAVKKESGKGLMSAFMGFIFGVLTIFGSTMYVAPMIMTSSLVQGKGVDIGWVMTMANWVTYIATAVTILMVGVLFYSIVLRPFAPAMVDRGILKIPFYRDMVMAKTNYMVFFGLAVLLKAGLRVEEAISLTVNTTPKGELRNDLERAQKALIHGSAQPWPYAMTMLHPTDRAALATAQDRTQTARTIEDLAIQYQMLYRSRLELFVPVMQILAAVFLSFAGFVLFAVSTVPLLQSMSSILNMM